MVLAPGMVYDDIMRTNYAMMIITKDLLVLNVHMPSDSSDGEDSDDIGESEFQYHVLRSN